MDDNDLVDSTPITSGRIQPAVPDGQPLDGPPAPEVGDDQRDRPELGEPDDLETDPPADPDRRRAAPSDRTR
jgi:hypothetical protein